MTRLSGPVLFRADASATIGVGHVMRCLALAQRLVDSGYGVTFAVQECPPALRERLAGEGFAIHDITAERGSAGDAAETSALARSFGVDWVVVDGYAFDGAYHAAIRSVARLLTFDDNGDVPHHVADRVLNQNIHARESLYSQREPHTQLLLGPRFALLRRELLAVGTEARARPREGRRLVVLFGGSDPADVSSRVLDAAPALAAADVDVTVVVGGASPRAEALLARATGLPEGVRVVVDPADLSERLAAADVALAAGGVTSLELAYLGVPSLLVVAAKNQRAVVEELSARGASAALGDAARLDGATLAREVGPLLDDASRRRSMADAGMALVDGHGSARVTAALGGRPMTLRRAREGDAALLFEWTNDPIVRASSFETKPVEWEGHLGWLKARLCSPTSALYLGHDDSGLPIGLVRFEQREERAEVGVSVASGFRGQGRATPLLNAATSAFWREHARRPVDAYIRPSNEASLRAFRAAGFVNEGTAVVKGVDALHLVKRPHTAGEGGTNAHREA